MHTKKRPELRGDRWMSHWPAPKGASCHGWDEASLGFPIGCAASGLNGSTVLAGSERCNAGVSTHAGCGSWRAGGEFRQVRNGDAPPACLEEQRINSNSSAKAWVKLSKRGLLEGGCCEGVGGWGQGRSPSADDPSLSPPIRKIKRLWPVITPDCLSQGLGSHPFEM